MSDEILFDESTKDPYLITLDITAPASYNIIQNKNPDIYFQCDGTWIMKIAKGKISFNREEFPDLCEDDFAFRVLKILEEINVITVDQSSWDHNRISNER